MKLVKSVSSLRSIFLSFGVLFIVFLMKSSRLMPVESLYVPLSRLESVIHIKVSNINLEL